MFRVLRKATASQLEEIRKKYDNDRSGHLDLFELKATLCDLGLKSIPMAECRRLFKKHDERCVGQISLAEIIRRSKATTVELGSSSPRSVAAAAGSTVRRPTSASGPTAATRYFAGLTNSVVQREALITADAAIARISTAADIAFESGAIGVVPAPGTTRYFGYGGHQMEQYLEHIDLIDAQYLIALCVNGGVVPPWQLVPEAARISTRNVWRLQLWDCAFSLPVLVLSVPWFDPDHPDNKGESLRRIVPLLELLVRHAKRYSEHATIGVFWDFPSMPQGPNRTPDEQVRFDCALRAAPLWYTHPFTIVLLVDTPVPPPTAFYDEHGHVVRREKAHANSRSFEGRGWCAFELRCASLIKDSQCLWSLNLSTWSIDDYVAGSFRACQKMLSQGNRPPLTSPVFFSRELKEGIATEDLAFSVQNDVETVTKLYNVAFVRAFDQYAVFFDKSTHMHFRQMGFGDDVVSTIVDALRYANSHCAPVCRLGFDLTDNEFSEEGKYRLRTALPETARFYTML